MEGKNGQWKRPRKEIIGDGTEELSKGQRN
jgi:hypothetical protein